MVLTRTYTYFFTADQIVPLLEHLEALEKDWKERRPFVPEWSQRRGDALLAQATAAVLLMNERGD